MGASVSTVFNSSNVFRIEIKPSKIVKYEGDGNTDLALIELKEEIDIMQYSPICLPKKG